ncbi:hypothetical protein DFH05DRAFT_1477179 [Lentinula detonsa]|uniref:Uncharacterized protein n=1 Tax=Lentinula detonsa TaxID=2804962 RepID=A0A9W8P9I3_9AGAR|nr:hypothetical protein DFH05DRAFT_1477179 [Lentinula detonsa]
MAYVVLVVLSFLLSLQGFLVMGQNFHNGENNAFTIKRGTKSDGHDRRFRLLLVLLHPSYEGRSALEIDERR